MAPPPPKGGHGWLQYEWISTENSRPWFPTWQRQKMKLIREKIWENLPLPAGGCCLFVTAKKQHRSPEWISGACEERVGPAILRPVTSAWLFIQFRLSCTAKEEFLAKKSMHAYFGAYDYIVANYEWFKVTAASKSDLYCGRLSWRTKQKLKILDKVVLRSTMVCLCEQRKWASRPRFLKSKLVRWE